MNIAFVNLVACALIACAQAPSRPGTVTWEQISGRAASPADHRIHYREDALTFGDLRLPRGAGPHPVAVVIHGGCWQSEYDLKYMSHLSAALSQAGIATWTLEYRRIGHDGGGWTGTFEDVARGTDYVRTLAQKFPLDVNRVVVIGHSAGGHLALWLAARRNLPRESPLFISNPLPLRGVVSLAGITDLRKYGAGAGSCNASVTPLLGGKPNDVPSRYAQTNPSELLPLGVPVRLIHGALDPYVPVEQSRDFAALARNKGDNASFLLVPEIAHFDLVAPFAPVWERIQNEITSLVSQKGH
jgi:acetyl esterase/lipase